MRRLLFVLTLLLSTLDAAAATRREFPGAWYTDATPAGAYAAAVRGGGIVTNLTEAGVIASPEAGDGILYVRLNNDGTRFAGQSHAGKGSWEWMPGWRLDPNPAFGVSGLIYDALNVLRFAVPGVTGSQGYRYVEDGTGRLVTGDETYSDPSRRIWEFSTFGDITVGQGEAGCIALRGASRYMLERGDCRFVRFKRAGDMLSVAMVKLAEGKSVILWLTADELASFPPEPPASLPPTSPTEPTPAPTPQPQNVRLTAAQLATLKAVRAKYGTFVTPEEIGAILNETAWRHRNDAGQRLGLQDKPGGTVAVQPGTGRRIWNGLRIVLANGDHYGGDVCGACSVGRFEPVDAEFGGPTDPSLFVAPVDPSGSGPVPPTPGDDVPALKRRIAELEQQVATLTIAEAQALAALATTRRELESAAAAYAELQARAEELQAELEKARQELAATQAKLASVGCEAKVPAVLRALGIRVGCTVTGR